MNLSRAEENSEAQLPEPLAGKGRHRGHLAADLNRESSIGRAAGRIIRKTGRIADRQAGRPSESLTGRYASPKAGRKASQIAEWKAAGTQEPRVRARELIDDQIIGRTAGRLPGRS